MPKPTWTNLPDDKRERIVDAAMTEFGSRGFSAGSLNVIARDAGVAKGSLFQYFDDKLDLFAMVCDEGSTRIERAIVADLDAGMPFFDLMGRIVHRWIDYFRDHPRERRMAFAVANEIDDAARAAVRGVANAHFEQVLRPLVDLAAERGEFRADVDPDIVISLVTLVLRHLDSAPFDPNGDPAIAFTRLDDTRVRSVADDYVETLRRAFT
ncbi:TetR/AcrR family transcriptional regulator [Actinospongicola halichondriae]|uniref:TetR/AcrR family transcriptional regulator n=1 Tax=Actinospongicola halichondriae TaxID=3236844 RepID=UPI003D4D02FB